MVPRGLVGTRGATAATAIAARRAVAMADPGAMSGDSENWPLQAGRDLAIGCEKSWCIGAGLDAIGPPTGQERFAARTSDRDWKGLVFELGIRAGSIRSLSQ